MLTISCLDVVAETVTPIALDTYCGSALRGAFFRAIWGRFCTNRESPICSACPLVMACPVASLVAPLRDEATHGRDVPRPYVISPPYKEPNCYKQGEMLTFAFSLVGTSAKLFPYVIRSLQEMERANFGHPLPELGGQRGRFNIREVYAYHPLTGERQLLWEKGSTRPQKPQIWVTPSDVSLYAEQLPTDHITLEFLSPTRLIFDEHLVKHPSFRVLMLRLAERLKHLQEEYSDDTEEPRKEEAPTDQGWYRQIDAQASEVRLVGDETHWVDVQSYSKRQRKATPIGGFVGKASFAGDLTRLRELLVWGQMLHVGKNAVKGNGLYRIEV